MDPRIEQHRQELRTKHVDDLVADLRRLAGPGQMGCLRAGGLLAAADRLENVWAVMKRVAESAGIDPERV